MLLQQKNTFVFHKVIFLLGLAVLVSCGHGKPENIEGAAQTGQQLEERGNVEAASRQYAAALRTAPNDSELLRDYGRTLLKMNRPSEAKVQYQKALDENSDDIKAMNGLGVSLDYLKQHSAAQAVYREALDEDPDDIVTLANLGHSYVLSGAWQEAIKLLEPHLQDKGATPAFRQNLAEAYSMAGMDADAERVMRMDLAPEQIKRNLAYYRAHRSDYGPALTADLGSFPTSAMAEVHAAEIKDQFENEVEGLSVTVAPEVKTIGSTPVFAVHVVGFERAARLRSFCAALKKEGEVCTAHIPIMK